MTRRQLAAAVALVTGVAAAIRLPALRALPIFGDEAIFLRLARIIRADPVGQLWSPLMAPSAPLHPWLLSLSLPLSPDPVRSGRLLSVLCGLLLVPTLAWVAWRLTEALAADRERIAPAAALTSAILVATLPFPVFSDRIARVDSLFALETALVVGLSVSLASRPSPRLVVLFGLLMGFAMLTRQAVSYPLWLLPLAAALLCRATEGRHSVFRGFFLAISVALVLWVPMLLARGSTDLMTRIFHVSLSRPSLGFADRVELVVRNLGIAGAAFWTYLTPPVCVVALAGLTIAAVTHRRLFWFLAAWEAIVLLPPVLFAGDYFPRYALPAALPLVIAGALAVASVRRRSSRWFAPALLAVVVVWGLNDVWRGVTDWRRWRFLPVDHTQFVSGWSAGYASERAADSLIEVSRKTPIRVILPKISGNPSDALWLRLDKNPNVRLFYAEDFLNLPVLGSTAAGRVRLQGDIWAGRPIESIRLDPDSSVLFVSTDPVFLGHAGWAPAATVVLPRNPGARILARFENPPETGAARPNAVLVFRIQ